MHRDVILVPAYFRPEFLYLCLENIYNARGSENKDIWICHDRKFGDEEQFAGDLLEIEAVVEYWHRIFGNRLKPVMRPQTGYYGNSYNVLQAYRKAFQTDCKYVYLIEDDVLITPDFFEWHEKIQSSSVEPFCTIAGSCDRNHYPSGADDPDDYFNSSEYASLGVCWKRENLESILVHANQDYYRTLGAYVVQHFPHSKMGLKMVEQDGLIQRIMEQQFKFATYAVNSKAFHVGVYGYHRSIGADNMISGTLPERTDFWRSAVSDKNWLEKVAGGFQTDIQPFPRA